MDQISREPFPWLRRIRDEDYAATRDMGDEALIGYFHERAEAVNANLGVNLSDPGDDGRELVRLRDARRGAYGDDV